MRVVRTTPLLILVALTLFPGLSFAAQPDRIVGPLASGQMVSLQGNVHGLARSEFDQGRTDGSTMLSGVSLVFKPSAAQRKDLDKLLVQQRTPSSPNFHKWLTPAQFADRFGMTQRDVNKVSSWLQGQGFTVTRVANSRNQIFFSGTVAQIEAAFNTEIHNYMVKGEVYYANATEPSVPVALSGAVLSVLNLHSFQPKPKAKFRTISPDGSSPRFTSHISGSHFLSPGDFATIYDVQGLYSAGADGTGQKIVLVGQSAISLTDISNFRSAAGLSAKAPTITLMPGTGTSTVCSGDEGESDLDVEWSGGVAKNATIIFVYTGLVAGDSCSGSRHFGAFDALQYAVDQDLAPVISSSYGNCEGNIGSAFALTMQGWAQQANTQGQTIFSASGDSGAADCDFHVTSATQGLAVDLPGAIPEVTSAGGTEFNGDAAGTVSGQDAGETTYWLGTSGGTDAISSARSYIPEMGWNDTTFDLANQGDISASGGGKSTLFTKPSWQTGTGVPSDGQRDVPDISVNASADHDGYLFCTSDGGTSCGDGFRVSSSDTSLTVVGGTSAAAPTLAAIFALINQYLGNSPPAGLGNINPNLYTFVASNSSAFNDVQSGNNIVPCTSGTTGCPTTAPFQYGFSAGVGYDQVTGLGSVNAFTLAQAWASSLAGFTLSASPSTLTVVAGHTSATSTIMLTPDTGFSGTVNYACSGLPTGATCNLTAVNSTTETLTIQTSASTAVTTSAATVTITGTSGAVSGSTTVSLNVTATDQSYTITPSVPTLSVSQGSGGTVTITVNPVNGFNSPLTFSCTDPASESTCTGPTTATTQTQVSIQITTTAPTAQLRGPSKRGSRIFYASLLPGLLGIFLIGGSRQRYARGMRMLGLIMVLGFSTLWGTSCGGTSSSSNKNAGTAIGSSTITVNATTAGANPITASTTFTLTVTAN